MLYEVITPAQKMLITRCMIRVPVGICYIRQVKPVFAAETDYFIGCAAVNCNRLQVGKNLRRVMS